MPFLVSIHAPTWGVRRFDLILRFDSIFQLTHPRGGATKVLWDIRYFASFNSHTHAGVRQYMLCVNFNSRTHVEVRRIGPLTGVSIHAPPWECDDKYFSSIMIVDPFQLTHPRGVRLVVSRPSCQLFKVSIHAPTWGATDQKRPRRLDWTCFNSRTHVGCDSKNRQNISHISSLLTAFFL